MIRMHAAALAFGLLVAIGTAAAAPIDYDTSRFIILDGFVRSVDWSSANFRVTFHSNDGYSGADWTLEGPAPSYLKALGWKSDTIRTGDRIDAVVYPDKRGTPNARLLRFLLADYRSLETGPYSASLLYPAGAIKQAAARAAEDPLASMYGNTLACTTSELRPPEANHSCRIWINADHTIRILRKKTFNGLNADGSFNLATDTGIWWTETQLGRPVLCSLIDNAPMPRCDTAVARRRVGDMWTVTVHGAKADWTETWELEQGRSH